MKNILLLAVGLLLHLLKTVVLYSPKTQFLFAGVDPVLLYVLLLGLYQGGAITLVVGTGMGLIADVSVSRFFGVHILVYTLAALAGNYLKERIFKEKKWTLVAVFIFFSLLSNSITAFLSRLYLNQLSFWGYTQKMLLGVISTALTGLLMLPICKKLFLFVKDLR